jgi:hypothetical protein
MTFVQYSIAESSFQEHQVKAAFIFNIIKFVEWPEGFFKNQQAPIIISILGKDPFREALETFKDKTINGRGIVIKRVHSLESLERSHVIFVSKSEKDSLREIIRLAGQLGALTIGDVKGFAQSGGIINLVNIGNRIGFEINVSAADRANLKVSSKLLKLGTIVNNN